MKAQHFTQENQLTPPIAEVTEKTVSVVMVSYHTGPVLWRSIESVLRQRNLHELVIVDNGNPEIVQQKLHRLAEDTTQVTYIGGHGNIGFASGCNKGVRETSGHYLLLVNPDCVLPLDTLKRTIATFEEHPSAWVASCCLVNPDHTEQGSSRRNILTPTSALIESSHLYRILPKNFSKLRLNFHEPTKPSQAYFVPAISGAFMFMRRETYLTLKGIDEGYFLHVEDLDFCLQINKNGGKILYIPDITVVHYHNTSSVSTFFVERHKARGFIRYFKKNFADTYMPGILPLLYAAVYVRLGFKYVLNAIRSLNPKKLLLRNNNTASILEERRLRLLESHSQPYFTGPGRALFPQLEPHSPILLTGATGQVGLCILRRLLASGVKVTCVYHSKIVDFIHPNLSWLQSDLKNDLLDLEEYTPKTVIHTAAIWLLPRHLETLSEAGVKRVITFSSTSVFGKAQSGNPYEQVLVERFKKAEEAIATLCAKYGIEWTIIRPTLIYGVGLDQNISSIVRFIKRFGCFPIYGHGKGKRKPVHADDLASSVLSIISNPASYRKSYNLCGGEMLDYYTMVKRIFALLGKRRVIIKTGILPKLLDVYSKFTGNSDTNGEIAKRMNTDLVFDDQEARQDFGYCPRDFLVGELEDIEPVFRA